MFPMNIRLFQVHGLCNPMPRACNTHYMAHVYILAAYIHYIMKELIFSSPL